MCSDHKGHGDNEWHTTPAKNVKDAQVYFYQETKHVLRQAVREREAHRAPHDTKD